MTGAFASHQPAREAMELAGQRLSQLRERATGCHSRAILHKVTHSLRISGSSLTDDVVMALSVEPAQAAET